MATNNNAVNAVTEYMYGKTVQALNESESAALLKEFKTMAQSYLEQYNILEPKIKEYNNNKDKTEKLRKGLRGQWTLDNFTGEGLIQKDILILDIMRKQRNEILELLPSFQSIALDFQDLYNEFLERKITLTYVDGRTGQVFFTKEGKEKELWKSGSTAASANLTLAGKTKIKQNSVSLEDIYNELTGDISENLKKRHQAILGAYKTGMDRITVPWIYIHENYGKTGKRIYLYIGNRGNFSEAYVAHIFDTDTPWQFSGNDDKGIHHLFERHLQNVTSLWGGIEGDISTSRGAKSLGGHGFAVKGDGASLGGWSYFKTVAQYIVNSSDTLTKQDLEAFIKNDKELMSEGIMSQASEEALEKIQSAADYAGAQTWAKSNKSSSDVYIKKISAKTS